MSLGFGRKIQKLVRLQGERGNSTQHQKSGSNLGCWSCEALPAAPVMLVFPPRAIQVPQPYITGGRVFHFKYTFAVRFKDKQIVSCE